MNRTKYPSLFRLEQLQNECSFIRFEKMTTEMYIGKYKCSYENDNLICWRGDYSKHFSFDTIDRKIIGSNMRERELIKLIHSLEKKIGFDYEKYYENKWPKIDVRNGYEKFNDVYFGLESDTCNRYRCVFNWPDYLDCFSKKRYAKWSINSGGLKLEHASFNPNEMAEVTDLLIKEFGSK